MNRCLLCALLVVFPLVGCVGPLPELCLEVPPEPPPRAAIRVDFPEDESIPYDRIAVHIGIDSYPKMWPGRQLDGCVNDVLAMRDVFAGRFGFERYAVVTDAEATRKGIQELLLALERQVAFATSKTDQPVCVLINYAGHGDRVADQATQAEGRDESDDCTDETWVASDGVLDSGIADIRDDDIEKLCARLVGMGAQVLVISDSCHSGTIHRGAPFAKQRTLNRPDERPAPGPSESLFPDWPSPPKTRGGSPLPVPGLVSYSACVDARSAYETLDELGCPCGRFSLVMRRTLLTMDPKTSYRALYDRICTRFSERVEWSAQGQEPQFHCASGKICDAFLGGRGTAVPPFAEIREGRQRGTTVELKMGRLQGIAEGSKFVVYATSDDLFLNQEPIAEAEVTRSDALTCEVALSRNVQLSPRAVAMPVSSPVADYAVCLGENLPDPVRMALATLEAEGKLRLSTNAYSVAVYFDTASATLGLYPPTALPDPKTGEGGEALLTVPVADLEQGVESLSKELAKLAKVERLLGLTHDEGLLEVVLVARKNGDASSEPVQPPRVRGAFQVADGDLVDFRLSNKSSGPLYVSLFAIPPNLEPKLLYPGPGQERIPIQPGEDVTLDRNTIQIRADRVTVRHRVKAIATGECIDFRPLFDDTAGLGTARGTIRGADNPLFDLMSHVVEGHPGVRGEERPELRNPGMTWATATLLIEIAPKGGGE
jgi:hypothetical protein